jgi:F-type H+-transporting ATPase subunit epsilon
MSGLVVSIITPKALHSETTTDMVVVNAAEGELGIMSGHIPVSAILKAGEIKFYDADKIVKTYSIESGFIEVLDNKCTILTEAVSE